jgi:hypothetical protein
VVTATFQRLYVFALLDISTRRVVHWNLADHPRSEWTIQQFRNGLPVDGTYRFLVHDRDGIFAPAVDEALRSMSLPAGTHRGLSFAEYRVNSLISGGQLVEAAGVEPDLEEDRK